MTKLLLNGPLVVTMLILLGGLWMMLRRTHLIKFLIGLSMVESAVNLFLVAIGFRFNAIAPIYTNAPEGMPMTLPTVQALTLTSIVIGLATMALLLSFAIWIYRHYHTLDVREIRKLRG